MSKKALSTLCFCYAIFAAAGVYAAADDAAATGAQAEKGARFDSRIDAWVDGSIVALDADSHKFTVKGYKMPYATVYSSMEKEVAEKTANITDPAQRNIKAADLRATWQDKLNKARADRDRKQGDFTFSTPAKGELSIMDERSIQNVDFLREDRGIAATEKTGGEKGEPTTYKGDEPRKTAEQKTAEAMTTFKDLKIGDKVLVGYDTGVITNEAYTLVKQQAK